MIETKVEGDPSAVDTAALFLTSTLKKAADDAGDDAVSARSKAMSAWDGSASDAYRGVATKLVKAADEQSGAAKKAGNKFEDYAAELRQIQKNMRQRRTRAREGDLTVDGTVIEKPDDAVPPADLPAGSTHAESQAWDRKNDAFETQKAKVTLYNNLSEEVIDNWKTFDEWIDTNLKSFASKKDESSLAELAVGALEKSPAAAVAFALDHHARSLARYSTDARSDARTLRRQASEARAARRSGHPARRAAGEAVDMGEARRGARALEETAEGAGRLAKRVPILGYAISGGLDAYAIANGESPGKVIASEGAGIAGGILGGAAVVGGAALIGVGAPVIAVAAGAAIVGVGASLGAEYAWDHWVPDGAKDAIDEGLKDFGSGVKDVAGDVGDAITFWN